MNIFIYCDQLIERRALTSLLEEFPEYSLNWDINGQEELITCLSEKKQGVIIFCLTSVRDCDFNFIRRIKTKFPDIGLIILAPFFNLSLALEFQSSGASTFLVKTCNSNDLLSAIRNLTGRNSQKFPDFFPGRFSLAEYYDFSKNLGRLTNREIEILTMVASGKTTKQISADLGISDRSVDVHRQNISRKIGVKGISGFTRYALQMELISL
ncbi:MAG: response regulator transcription factor [Pseudomonadota bacterium]